MYLKTSEGVRKSVDGGVIWSVSAAGLGQRPLTFLVMDPRNSSLLYAGAADGVFRSTDAGATWAPFSDVAVRSLVLHPQRSGVMLASASSASYRSSDGGASWQPMAGLPASDRGYLLTLAPSDPDVVYASSEYLRLYKSTDAGLTWIALSPLTSEYSFNLRYVAVDPKTAMTVYVGATPIIPGMPAFHYKSVNGGASWTLLRGGLPTFNGSVTGQIAFDPLSPTTLYSGSIGGIYRSSDDGDSWTLTGAELPARDRVEQPIQVISFNPVNPRVVYVGVKTEGGPTLYRSTDGIGSPWVLLQAGIRGSTVTTLFSSDSALFAGSAGGVSVFRSNDQGTTWAPYAQGLPPGAVVNSLAGKIGVADVLYVATSMGVFKRTDGASAWDAASSGLPAEAGVAVAVHPANSSVVYAATVSGVYKSTDGAASWVPASNGLPAPMQGGGQDMPFAITSLAVDPSNSSVVYVAGGGGGAASARVYKSRDGGASWQASGSGITTQQASGGESVPFITRFSISPSAPQTLYALGSAYLFRSRDGGSNWTRVAIPENRSLSAIAVDAVNPDIVYVGNTAYNSTFNKACSSILRSEDGGQTWGAPGVGTPCEAVVQAIVVDRGVTDTVYAGLEGAGVYKWVTRSAVNVGSGELYLLADARPVQLANGSTVNVSPQSPADAAGSVISLPATGTARLQLYGSSFSTLLMSGPNAKVQVLDGSMAAIRLLSGTAVIDSASKGPLTLLDVGTPSGSQGLVASGQVVSSGAGGAVVEASALGDASTLFTVLAGTITSPCGALCPVGVSTQPTQMLVYAAERALQGPDGQLRRLQIVLPMFDLQTLGSVTWAFDVPQLAGARPTRALGTGLIEPLPSLLATLLGGVAQLQGFSDAGAVLMQVGAAKVGALPVGLPTVTVRVPDGARIAPNGNLHTVHRGIAMEFAPMVPQMNALVTALREIDAQSQIKVLAGGAWKFQLAASTLIVRPSWFSVPGTAPERPSFSTDEARRSVFVDAQGQRSTLYPALADADRLLTALSALDANAQIAVQPDGATWAKLHGQQYWLTPNAELVPVPTSRTGDLIWDEGSGASRVLWMQVGEGMAQSMGVRVYP